MTAASAMVGIVKLIQIIPPVCCLIGGLGWLRVKMHIKLLQRKYT